MAAKLLGLKEVPVNYQDYESDDQEGADLHADNAIASWAEIDLSFINQDMENFGPEFDIHMLGIKNFALDVSDFEEPKPKEDPGQKAVDLKTCPNCGVTISG